MDQFSTVDTAVARGLSVPDRVSNLGHSSEYQAVKLYKESFFFL